MQGITNITFFYKGGILLGSETRSRNGSSFARNDYNTKIVRLNDHLFVTKCGQKVGAVNSSVAKICHVTPNTLHIPESLANEAYKFLEQRKIGHVVTLIVGYSGGVPEIYKVQWKPGVQFPDRNGAEIIEIFFVIGSGAPYALATLERVYVPDIPREASKNLG
ncbi:PREDICTED: uncharacterized protein LOC103322495 [Prunus mume]|uniref:Uncharacterized protein LOC103322495 n=1 Tax=Prunus mume TaxID=102107 RepID=A0ABM0NCB6_PRUMU|nr:PREDICTED: uncharacterized protein LOC103322495 [Prunus mume]